MNYFSELPIELNTIILSYILPRDYNNIIQIINKVDYYQLFKLQFRYYYKKNIIDYDIKILYEDIIKLFHLKYDKFFKNITFYEDSLEIFKKGNIQGFNRYDRK